MAEADGNPGFLPLAEAARRLGLSRLKLREAIARGVVAARRDNEGRLRIDLTSVPADLRGAMAAAPVAPEALMGALFDEIEDLSGDLEQANDTTDRMVRLAGAQADALERAARALESATAERDRLGEIAGRALAAAEQAETRAAALSATTARALDLLDRSGRMMEGMKAEIDSLRSESGAREAAIAAHAAQLERLFVLSEQAMEQAAATRRAPSLIARVFGAPRKA